METTDVGIKLGSHTCRFVESSYEIQTICDVAITFLQSSLDHIAQAATPGPLTECRSENTLASIPKDVVGHYLSSDLFWPPGDLISLLWYAVGVCSCSVHHDMLQQHSVYMLDMH